MRSKIIVTRPEEKSPVAYSGKCFETLNIPVTRLVRNRNVDTAKITAFMPTICVFTSSRGAEIFLELFTSGTISEAKAVAIGDKTSSTLSAMYHGVLVPEEKTSRGVNYLLNNIVKEGDRIVLFSSAKTNRVILRHLEERKWTHMSVELYDAETLDIDPVSQELAKSNCFGILVTSSMEATAIFGQRNSKSLTESDVAGKRVFAIGETTANALRELGIKVSEPVGKSDIKALLIEIERVYCN